MYEGVDVGGTHDHPHPVEWTDPPAQRPSFEEFYEAQYAGVYAYVLRRLSGPREDVADVTAEIFATAWRRADRIPPRPEDRLWIYGVARRVLSRHLRGQWRRSRLQRRLQAEAAIDTSDDESPRRATDHERLRSAMSSLRPADREALTLVLWEGLSHAEAAEVLGCSANAVGLRLHRARQRLRRELDLDTQKKEVEP